MLKLLNYVYVLLKMKKIFVNKDLIFYQMYEFILSYQILKMLSFFQLDESERLKQPLISAKDMIKVELIDIKEFFIKIIFVVQNLVLKKNTSQSLLQRYCSALKILSQMEVRYYIE